LHGAGGIAFRALENNRRPIPARVQIGITILPLFFSTAAAGETGEMAGRIHTLADHPQPYRNQLRAPGLDPKSPDVSNFGQIPA
jgi:hypothetical protein